MHCHISSLLLSQAFFFYSRGFNRLPSRRCAWKSSGHIQMFEIVLQWKTAVMAFLTDRLLWVWPPWSLCPVLYPGNGRPAVMAWLTDRLLWVWPPWSLCPVLYPGNGRPAVMAWLTDRLLWLWPPWSLCPVLYPGRACKFHQSQKRSLRKNRKTTWINQVRQKTDWTLFLK